MQIPMVALAPPALPAESPASPVSWRFNVYRVSVADSGEAEYQALYPTGRIDFHRPRSFGKLVFVS